MSPTVSALTGHMDEIDERYRNGETLASIAKDFGVTRERIRQKLEFTGATAAMSYQARKLARLKAQLENNMKYAMPCRVCGAWVLRRKHASAKPLTCSSECSKAWSSLRYHIDDRTRRQHSTLMARWYLRNSKDPVKIRYAKKVLAGELPLVGETHGRWFVSGSKNEQMAKKLGITIGGSA